jgi:hypothetical protein
LDVKSLYLKIVGVVAVTLLVLGSVVLGIIYSYGDYSPIPILIDTLNDFTIRANSLIHYVGLLSIALISSILNDTNLDSRRKKVQSLMLLLVSAGLFEYSKIQIQSSLGYMPLRFDAVWTSAVLTNPVLMIVAGVITLSTSVIHAIGIDTLLYSMRGNRPYERPDYIRSVWGLIRLNLKGFQSRLTTNIM